jgi:Pup amidohydrolase
MKVFDRLVGLETEYAVRFRPAPGAERPTDYDLFEALVAALRRRIPAAGADPAGQGKPGIFLANGGAVWFERYRPALTTGLVEGCTPECRSPRRLLACQRAQDRLLAEAARDAGMDGSFLLVKNCRDSRGNSYGAQESYDAVLARGWRLVLWRAFWLSIGPIGLAVILALAFLLVGVLLTNLVVAGLLYFALAALVQPSAARRRRWHTLFFGRYWVTHDDVDAAWPAWLEPPIFLLLKIGLTPLMLLTSGVVALMDVRRTQRQMFAFLASRAVLGGSGWLDRRGQFHLAEKAESRRTVWTEVVPDSSRPVFNVAHFWKLACSFGPRWKELFAGRQRLQISLGDSNCCEEAEYLRFATTLLVVDASEAGALGEAPRVRFPLRALRQISRDPTLTTAVPLRGGERMTALQLQRWYFDACRRFVADRPDAPDEAREVLRRWADVLDRLERNKPSLVGRLDWVTKEYLLQRAGNELPAAARKKLDLRYHELSPEGYFRRLEEVGLTAGLLEEAEVEQAMRLPPPGSPAVQRARYIREFSGRDTLLKVSWRLLRVTEGGKTTTIPLTDPPPQADSPETPTTT